MYAVDTIVLVCPLALWRSCFGRVLAAEFSDVAVLTFSNLREWYVGNGCCGRFPLLVILELGNSIDLNDFHKIIVRNPNVRATIISDSGNSSRIFEALSFGVRAYIPNDQGLEVAIRAIRLVVAGGSFMPASLLRENKISYRSIQVDTQSGDCFRISKRQLQIIASIRRGKTNAAIARDLNISEATIKVHIRNIMKKMGVNTRTAIAFRSKEIL